MCLKRMKINASSPFAPKELFIPCGDCAECRQVYRTGWRIRLEHDLKTYSKKGWKIGFFTLTYNATSLPSVPAHLVINPNDFIACFDRVHARTFIDDLRKWLWKHYHITNVRYLIASEYGEHTKRPHYHGLICWPADPYEYTNSKGQTIKTIPLEPECLHAKIKELWTPNGFTFPEKFDGSGKYDKSPFEVVNTVENVANYASKYCVKDLCFQESIEKKVIDIHSKELRRYKGFHIQSKSLGLSYIKNLSEKEKLDLVRDGIFTPGQSENCPLPLYYKKKILFNPYYIIDETTGKRLVRQEASDFLLKHYEIIFQKKVDFYKSTFDLVRSSDYQQNIKDETAKKVIRNINLTSHSLAIYYVAFYGTTINHLTTRPQDAWLSRYIQNCDILPYYDNGNLPTKWRFDYYINTLFQQLNNETETTKKIFEEREKNRLQDFHNNPIT